jgi:drug/metabolite transporter (DMT)-like permease
MLKNMNQGIKHILIAGLYFSLINAAVKYYSRIPAIQIVFFRSLVSFIITGFLLLRNNDLKVINPHSGLLFMRGLCGAIALSLYFTTIQYMPLASAVTILYLAPIFTVIFAAFMAKEPPHKMQIPFMLLSFAGAALIKGGDVNVDITFFIMGIVAAIFAGLAYNFIRLLKGKVSHLMIIFYFPLVTLPIVTPMTINQWVTPSSHELVGLIMIGVLTQLAQVSMTKAYLYERASKISHFNYLTSVYAVVASYVVFHEPVSPLSFIGIALIILGVIFSNRVGTA